MTRFILTVLIIDLSQEGAIDYQPLLQQNDEVSYRFSLASSEKEITALSQSHSLRYYPDNGRSH